ncbi:MAG: hypothetical protein IT548_08025 [Alphaproteobacteria bacterium]|nr:hypothetical protein [Alphaproteobacteria bacterium]
MFRRSLPTFAAAVAAFALLAGSASAGAAGPDLAEARDSVAGAQQDLEDARAYLADLKAGDFAGIYSVADDGTMRCGEVGSNPACQPLTAEDKAQAIAEAEEMVTSATAQLQDADVALASLKDVQNAAMASAQ